jgi:hypothetical protein
LNPHGVYAVPTAAIPPADAPAAALLDVPVNKPISPDEANVNLGDGKPPKRLSWLHFLLFGLLFLPEIIREKAGEGLLGGILLGIVLWLLSLRK